MAVCANRRLFQDNLNGRYPLARSSIQWSGAAAGSAPGGNVPVNTIQWVARAEHPACKPHGSRAAGRHTGGVLAGFLAPTA
ncbi:MAG: hypothetical protein HC889_01055 [Synechococcaceae cyanobacterium SM1_2_3]|nr:hypothetical protein [Synechococcaceae cyanobacterium SM1_2_3]